MRNVLFVFLVMLFAACTSSSVQPVNSYLYQVAATRSNSELTGMEEATRQVYAEAKAFCARQDRIVETDSLARFDQDAGRPGSATLRFRCVKSDAPEVSRISRN